MWISLYLSFSQLVGLLGSVFGILWYSKNSDFESQAVSSLHVNSASY